MTERERILSELLRGGGAIIMPGVTIGNHVVIGAEVSSQRIFLTM